MAEQGTHKPLVVCSNHILAIDHPPAEENMFFDCQNRDRRARTIAEPACLGLRFSI